MSPREIGWRVGSVVRDTVDRGRIATGLYPNETAAFGGAEPRVGPGFRVSDVEVGAWSKAAASAPEVEWRRRLARQADALAEHRFTFFDLSERHLGEPIDWNRDHSASKAAPLRFAPSIDYRDFRETGDCKLVWEPSRHHQLVVLGRAFRATGEKRYAAAVEEQLASWLDQCPFGIGMNWRSPLELSIRLINWVWALDLIEGSGYPSAPVRRRLLHTAWLHMWDVTRKYSQGSSANNHTIGEAAGVYIGASYWRGLAKVDTWRREAKEILVREAENQTYADGLNREQALGYHYFVLQFLLVCGLVGRWTEDEFPPRYWKQVEAMMNLAAAFTEGGPLPMIGDADDGYVLDLGGTRGDFGPLLAVGASLFGRADFKAQAGPPPEAARWLLAAGWASYVAIPDPVPAPLVSRAFADSGYYLLQHGIPGSPDSLSAVFDCGELGFGSISAHGHADALSVVVRAFGRDVLVDPGTYDYFTYPQWRSYFRSTDAHNTVVIDGQDQSRMLGLFLWGDRAHSRRVAWAPTPGGGSVVGEHDGYTRLADPVVHRRRVEVDGDRGFVTIEDRLEAQGSHEVSVAFHFAEDCDVSPRGDNVLVVALDGRSLRFEMDPSLEVRTVRGEPHPGGGWISRGYHRKTPATVVRGTARISGSATFTCRLALGAHPELNASAHKL